MVPLEDVAVPQGAVVIACPEDASQFGDYDLHGPFGYHALVAMPLDTMHGPFNAPSHTARLHHPPPVMG